MTEPLEQPTVYASSLRRLAQMWEDRSMSLPIGTADWRSGAVVTLGECADELRELADRAEHRNRP